MPTIIGPFIFGTLGIVFYFKQKKIKSSGLSIAGLVLSIISLVFFIFIATITIIWAAIIPMVSENIAEEPIVDSGTLNSDEYVFQGFYVYDYDSVTLEVTTTNPSSMMLLQENEFLRYEKGEEFYYIEGTLEAKRLFLGNHELNSGTYYLVIQGINDSLTYEYSISVD